MTDEDAAAFETKTIHAGQSPDPETGAVMPPIHPSSTFAQDAPGSHRGYEYARTGNPTRSTLEANLAALEGGGYARAFASGMAAIDAVSALLDPGDEVLVGRDVYGGTHRLFTQVYADTDITFDFVAMSDTEGVANAITDETALVWLESPTNPLLHIADIAAISDLAHDHEALCAVDNTFATPYLQRPLEWGADIVVHSLTKYLGGHSDVVGGVAITDDPELDDALGFYQNAVGATPDPFACFLVLRGTKTLAVRMDRHCENTETLAARLQSHEAVSSVYYPGLPEHPGHDIASRQMSGYGGMVSFELEGSGETARRLVSETELFTLAESLGGVESLIEQPATMTHASVPAETRQDIGVDDSLIRLSVGIEHVEDLQQDIERAIERAETTTT